MASNRSMSLLEEIDYTGTQDTVTLDNLNNPSAHFITNITSLSSGQYLQLHVIGVGETGAEYTIFTSLPMNQETTYRQLMGPNVNCVPGIACRDFMPKKFYLRIVPLIPGQTDAYSVDINLGLG